MQEKIEMPPRIFLEIVGFASSAACRARIFSSTIRSNLQMTLSWRMVSIKTLAHAPPWSREPQTQGKNFFRKHAPPLSDELTELLSCGQFYTKRRRT